MRFLEYKTDIETILFDLLEEAKLFFVFQYPIRCKYGYIADFYIPEYNLILEADGEAWHNKKRDNAKTNVLKSMGYSILRFKGRELIETPQQCLNKINALISERREKNG